jgi:hypothetical protein
MTIQWHVDDLMISCSSGKAISKFLCALKDIYGDNLPESTEKIHAYLGMTYDFSLQDEVKINMRRYISKVIEAFPEEIVEKTATPTGDHLFKVREDGQQLNEEQADAFQHTVFQLYFAANQVHHGIQKVVSFLTTREQEPDKDDWGKLKRILKYLKGTRYLKLTLSMDQLKFTVHWYVDGLHQIHEDCRGQMGSLLTFRKGSIVSSSNKMKCNTKSSTETELVLLCTRPAGQPQVDR